MIAKKKPAARTKKTSATSQSMLEQFELAGVRLLNSSSELKLSGGTLPQRMSITFGITLNEGKKHKVVLVNAGCTLILKQADESPDEQCTKISCVFQVVLNAKGVFPALDDASRKTIVTSGSVVAWPYLRSFLHFQCSSMGLPPFPLPLLHPMQSGPTIFRFGSTEVDFKQQHSQPQ